uniref:Uncharacterized protein n=1 Tax=Klebsiella pneumoniae TaxID=573 RepID=A0A8B0SVZ0_KLEPN|nr:hypothetical protein [Klebsiella pneumoniae]
MLQIFFSNAEDCCCGPAKGASDSAKKFLREQEGLRQYQCRMAKTNQRASA